MFHCLRIYQVQSPTSSLKFQLGSDLGVGLSFVRSPRNLGASHTPIPNQNSPYISLYKLQHRPQIAQGYLTSECFYQSLALRNNVKVPSLLTPLDVLTRERPGGVTVRDVDASFPFHNPSTQSQVGSQQARLLEQGQRKSSNDKNTVTFAMSEEMAMRRRTLLPRPQRNFGLKLY